MNKIPNPGSDEAIEQGCTCAVLDNRHGLGAYDSRDGCFWITEGCPLHDIESKAGGWEENERDRVIGEIIDIILTNPTTNVAHELADQILNIKGIAILADNQELPFISLFEAEEHDAKWAQSNFSDSLQEFGKKAQKDMLGSNFKRIIKESE